MKNLYLSVILVLSSFIFLNSASFSQSWKEMMDSCNAYQEAQDFETAIKWGELAIEKAKEQLGDLDTNIADISAVLTYNNYMLRNYEKALEWAKLDSTLRVNSHNKQNPNYIRTLQNLGAQYIQLGRFDDAETSYKESLNLARTIYSGDHPSLAGRINDMGMFYNSRGRYAEAEPLFKEALEMRRKTFKSDHPELATSINNLAMFYNDRGRYAEAEPLLKEALEMNKRIFKGDHSDLAMSINNIAIFYNDRGKYAEAEPLYKESLEMFRRLFKSDHPYLANSINNMGYFYTSWGRYAEAEPLYKEALEMKRRVFKSDHPDLAGSINNMASFYNGMGRFTEAEPLYKEALEMTKRTYKNDHPNLARSLNSLASFYDSRGRYTEAEPLYKEALEMRRRIFMSNHPDLANSINSIGYFYFGRGRYAEAEPLFKEALEMFRRIFKDNHPDLARSINNMAMFYNDKGRYAEAEPLYKESLEMFRRIFKNDHPDLANCINNMGYFYIGTGRYDDAEPLLMEALEMSRRIFKDNHPDLARSINNMAMFYNSRNRYSEAEPLLKEATDMSRRIYKTEHLDLAKGINNLALFYNGSGRYAEAEPLYIEALNVNMNMINNYFPSLSEKEKKQFWNTVSGSFEKFSSFSTYRSKENPEILSNMYDIQLYSKALLFNSVNRIKSRIENSGDSSLIKQYTIWSEIKEYLVKLYKLPDAELKKKGISIDSIEKVANELEKELSLKSEVFKQSYEKKKVGWKTIQAMLKPDEAAVEVVRYRYFDKSRFTDTIHYAFLIVNEQTEEDPDLVVLENGKELENEFYKDYLSKIKSKKEDKFSYNRYWSKLGEKLKGFKKIYFSADGIYNKINPGTFLMPDGKYLQDIQDIQQVNSTKDLLLSYYQTKQESNIVNSAILIGNPNFSLSEELVKEKSKKMKGNIKEDESWEQLASSRGMQLTRLPGTEKEINGIEKLLKDKYWKVNSYLGDEAIKTAVKTANNPRVLHIATHGLFLEDVKRGGSELFGFDEQKMVENPLLRSGLFFTGADNYLKSDKTVNATDDDNGLLTAYEAMNLDLDKTELVVLSACETGLGEIQNGEGVFGLRRAFQQAGAKTVMMSLWKVNDETTQELMTNFYSNWVTGMTKRDAFAKAQQTVKAKYPDPYYWGAFVMVGE